MALYPGQSIEQGTVGVHIGQHWTRNLAQRRGCRIEIDEHKTNHGFYTNLGQTKAARFEAYD